MSLEQVERQLAAHIRNPANCAGPEGMEQRRLKIYRDLFYNNIENFISNGFPVLRSLYADEPWHSMVRDFMVNHHCHSPYFLEISQEFLLYLHNVRKPQSVDPVFIKELAHYEWVELALDVAPDDLDDIQVDREGDLLQGLVVVSPLAWSLAYPYPVHKIGKDFQPQQPGDEATYIVVYRNRKDRVGFMEINAITARLLELLQAETPGSGQQALELIADEMQHPNPSLIVAGGLEILQQLRAAEIILGTR